jgi:hypothetical protein
MNTKYLIKPEVYKNYFKNPVPTSRKHTAHPLRTLILLLFIKMIVVCCKNHRKHTNSTFGQSAVFPNVEASSTNTTVSDLRVTGKR